VVAGTRIEMEVGITAGIRYGMDEVAITGMRSWDADGCWAAMLECKGWRPLGCIFE
jgi:hypothetical protein